MICYKIFLLAVVIDSFISSENIIDVRSDVGT